MTNTPPHDFHTALVEKDIRGTHIRKELDTLFEQTRRLSSAALPKGYAAHQSWALVGIAFDIGQTASGLPGYFAGGTAFLRRADGETVIGADLSTLGRDLFCDLADIQILLLEEGMLDLAQDAFSHHGPGFTFSKLTRQIILPEIDIFFDPRFHTRVLHLGDMISEVSRETAEDGNLARYRIGTFFRAPPESAHARIRAAAPLAEGAKLLRNLSSQHAPTLGEILPPGP